ncbi:PadR family transcriptional regulator [Roseivirga sp. E12]|uniref:PadR family transcriptional regulator n=1 Tax=Roseivirga sp. E12 TaxID=2819237 RepID=UPI001ABBE3BA|nr:PadR family transcriptional regulator [Roseivirga sp. E12]MBO3700116.1 PadR family transcriptional regulator [Roseivirga sp. E12]
MKGTNLGEFQELVLLTIGTLYPNAYGVGIKDEIRETTSRKVTLSTVHAALNRLEKKGLITSSFGEATKIRGGKRKRFFTITAYGLKTLQETRQQREQLWNAIPEQVFNVNWQV